MSFQGKEFCSYGTAIARHIEHAGRPAIIFNETGYSVTTSKHQNLILRAIPDGVPVFRFGDCGRGISLDNLSGAQLFEYAIKQAADEKAKAERARKNSGWHSGRAATWLASAQQVNEFFGLRRKVDEKTIERLRKVAAADERKRRKDAELREQQARAEQQQAFDNWLAGLPYEYFSPHIFPVAFRVEGEELVSSRGARVSMRSARVALAFAKSHRADGWTRNGEAHTVDGYTLDSVNPQGVVAGCHRITWEEIERIEPLIMAAT